jgi:hypothetical protein
MSSTLARPREKSHTPTSPTPTALPAPLPVSAPADEQVEPTYWGDRCGLIFWLACAGLLVALHVGQHVVYLLR